MDVFLRLIALTLLRSKALLIRFLLCVLLWHVEEIFPSCSRSCSVPGWLVERADAHAFAHARGRVHHCRSSGYAVLFIAESPDICRPNAVDRQPRSRPEHSTGGGTGRHR